jgi:hypothetical protein
MIKFLAAALALSIPLTATALAVDFEPVFSYWGSRANIIPRPADFYADQPTPAVEIENTGIGGSAHLLMTPDEALAFSEAIALAAKEANGL